MTTSRRVIFLVAITTISLLVHGYQFNVSDQEIIIPYILKSADKSLYPNDMLFNQPSASFSLFYSLYGWLIQAVNIQALFLISYIIVQFIFFYGVFYLARFFLANNYLSYLATLPFVLPKFIAGTANFTFDIFFSYRVIGVTAFIFFLGLLFRKKYILATAISALIVWIHPLSSVPHILLIFAFILFQSSSRVKDFTICFILLTLSALPLILFYKSSGTINPFQSNDVWLSIIRFRDSYVFPSEWSPQSWLSLAFYMSILYVFLKRFDLNVKKTILLVTLSCTAIFVLNIFLLEILRLPFFAQLQLVRTINPIAYISLVLTPLFLTEKSIIGKIIGTCCFITIIFNMFNLFLPIFIVYLIYDFNTKRYSVNHSHRIQPLLLFSFLILLIISQFPKVNRLDETIHFPLQSNAWADAQLWIKHNTLLTDTFILDPYLPSIRVLSERGIVGTFKDGAVVMYDPTYASYWYQMVKDLSGFNQLNTEDFHRLAGIYRFKYIITTKSHYLNLEMVYENPNYRIYKASNL